MTDWNYHCERMRSQASLFTIFDQPFRRAESKSSAPPVREDAEETQDWQDEADAYVGGYR